jgi:uncharacterized membrane protein YfcA
MTALDAALAVLVVAAGSCLQGAVGFGVNLVATPLLLLLDDVFVPAPVVLASALLNVLVVRREGSGSVDPMVRVAIVGQVVGAVAAGVTLSALPAGELSILFAGTVLAAVALSASGLHLRPTPPTLVGAGLASGFMGTLSGIGGPPIALVYQRADGPTLRGTLARYFLVGTAVSTVALTAAGVLGREELVAAAILLPGVVVGFAGSRFLVRHLDQREARPVVLGLSALAAVAVLLRELL